MPMLIVLTPTRLATDARRDLAWTLTETAARTRNVPAEKVQVFFTVAAGDGSSITMHAVTSPTTPDDEPAQLRRAARPHLAAAAVTVQDYPADHTARNGKLRT